MYPFIMKPNGSISLFVEGKNHVISPDNLNYEIIKQGIKDNNNELVKNSLSIPAAIAVWSHGKVQITDDFTVLFGGSPLHSSLADRMIEMVKDGFDVTPLSLFLENLMQNPSEMSRNELYDFLEHCDLPITEDGHFLAYKMVRSDYTDIHSGKFDNSVGAKPEVKREDVDDDRRNECSRGLHLCSFAYLKSGYARKDNNDRVMVVKCNPADVVCFPKDYNFSKGRVWRYEVVAEMDWEDNLPKHIVDDEFFETPETHVEDEQDMQETDVWQILDLLNLDEENRPSLAKIGTQFDMSARQVARIRDGEGPFGNPDTEVYKIRKAWVQNTRTLISDDIDFPYEWLQD